MDFHISEFFQCFSEEIPHGSYKEVIFLNERSDLSWDDVLEKVPAMPRGWYELAHLTPKDRIEFSYAHWNSVLPFHSKLNACLERFFSSLDDIGIFIIQCKASSTYQAQIVYSVNGNNGFYRGGVPIVDNEAEALQKTFSDYLLPADYCAFQRLHDGFWKTTDSTGIVTAKNLPALYEKFQNMLAREPVIATSCGVMVNPKSLIPFYESFGMPYFQCFWGEWYPEQEMGVVYYSSETKNISSIKTSGIDFDTLSFPTFSDWLTFYLEHID